VEVILQHPGDTTEQSGIVVSQQYFNLAHFERPPQYEACPPRKRPIRLAAKKGPTGEYYDARTSCSTVRIDGGQSDVYTARNRILGCHGIATMSGSAALKEKWTTTAQTLLFSLRQNMGALRREPSSCIFRGHAESVILLVCLMLAPGQRKMPEADVNSAPVVILR
jgi:hypothetical protein